jgi:O-antigen/teichoic acid export membrane protein
MDSKFKKKFLKGSLAVTIGQVFGVVANFVSIMILTRHLIKQDFGSFTLILTVSVLLQLVSGLGLDSTLVQFLNVKKNESKEIIFAKLLTIRLISLLVIVILFLIFNGFFILIDTTINSFTYQIIIIFLLYSLRDFYNARLTALKEYKGFAIIQVVSSGSKLLLYFLGYLLNLLSLEFLVYTEIGTLIISFIVQQKISVNSYRLFLKLKKPEISNIFHFSYPLYLNNLLTLVNNRTNYFIISGYLGVVAVANYDVAGKLSTAATKLYASFQLVFFPSLTELIGEEKFIQAKNLIEKSMLSISLLTLPFVFASYILRDEIIVLLFSRRYLDTSFALFLYSVSFYFRSLSSIAGFSLVAKGQTFLSFKSNLIGIITGILLSFILVPRIGIEGAIYGTITARIISSLTLILYLNKQNLHINLFKINTPLLLLGSFILIYEAIGAVNIYIKTSLILIFIISETLFFNDFRKLIREMTTSIRQGIMSSLKGLGISKT